MVYKSTLNSSAGHCECLPSKRNDRHALLMLKLVPHPTLCAPAASRFQATPPQSLHCFPPPLSKTTDPLNLLQNEPFFHLPPSSLCEKQGVSINCSMVSKWEQGFRKRACRKAVYAEGIFFLLFQGQQTPAGCKCSGDPDQAQPALLLSTVSETPPTPRRCLILSLGSPDMLFFFLRNYSGRLLKARSLCL